MSKRFKNILQLQGYCAALSLAYAFLILLPVSLETQVPDKNDLLLAETEINISLARIKNVSPQFKAIMRNGIESAYQNAPFLNDAFACFDSLIVIAPERPDGYFLKAAMYYSLYRFQSQSAQIDSLKRYTDITIEKCTKLIEKYPDDPMLYLYLGGVNGTIGLYYLVQKSYWNAYKYGKEGKRYLEKTLELDPAFADAKLGLGLFNYYSDILSPILKPILFLVGLSGDKEKGLEMVKDAIRSSDFSQLEAKYYLGRLYDKYEGKNEEASLLFASVLRKYPDNLYFQYRTGRSHYEFGKFRKARAVFKELVDTAPRKLIAYRKLIYYYYGLSLFETGQYKRAESYLNLAISLGRFTNESTREIFYARGVCLEILGRQDDAYNTFIQAKAIDAENRNSELVYYFKNRFSDLDKLKEQVRSSINDENYQLTESLFEEIALVFPDQKESSSIHLLASMMYRQNRRNDQKFASDMLIDDFESDQLRASYFIHFYEDITHPDREGAKRGFSDEIEKIDLKKINLYKLNRIKALQRKYLGEIKYH